jgi:hypothetical protein
MIRLLLSLLLLLPLGAAAFDPDEFHLFGVNARGEAFDITPFGGDEAAIGDPGKPGGIAGIFYNWRALRDGKFKTAPVGRCRVRNGQKYAFSCEPGSGALAGTAYAGGRIDVRDLEGNADAEKLYDAWIAKNVYGELAAYYRCTRGCSAAVPKSLIFIWFGD